MSQSGWAKLIPQGSCFHGEGAFRLEAYSEFMPPPRLGWKPYACQPVDEELYSPDDPWGWKVNEFDEALELQPGMRQIGGQIMSRLSRLLDGDRETSLPKHTLNDN